MAFMALNRGAIYWLDSEACRRLPSSVPIAHRGMGSLDVACESIDVKKRISIAILHQLCFE
jgi:hypothetical protein